LYVEISPLKCACNSMNCRY